MRMWMVDPRGMCDRHLLGEHVEIHMLVGCLRKRKNIRGYIEKGLVEVRSIRPRHDALVREMRRRHMNHASPLPRRMPFAEKGGPFGRVDREASLTELRRRCRRCRQMQNGQAGEKHPQEG
ncbi:MAG TPA: pyrimidine dimer DNA glycosylase/endonuclease V [Planctomycetota bacterium]|nr:pyrimidine dimer DNA glycosylase/endonuclease V [Planctomycetota bacterium]